MSKCLLKRLSFFNNSLYRTFVLPLCSLLFIVANAQTDKHEVNKKTQDMSPSAYLISLSIQDRNRYTWIQVFQAEENMRQVIGTSRNGTNMDLYILPESEKTTSELITQFQSLPGVQAVSVVELTKPIGSDVLKNVKAMLKDFKMDASSVTDPELIMFLESTIARDYVYCIRTDLKRNERGLSPVTIRRTEDLLREYSKSNNNTEIVKDSVEIYNGIEIHDITIQQIAEEPPPPPPPPPRNNNLSKMTDAQICQWLRKTYYRNLKNTDIQIKRSTTEVVIKIKLNETIETLHYKMNK